MRVWLMEYRDKKNLTQEQVAEASDVERSYYNMIERGNRRPSVAVAQKIGRVLEFDWTIFFTTEGNESTQSKVI